MFKKLLLFFVLRFDNACQKYEFNYSNVEKNLLFEVLFLTSQCFTQFRDCNFSSFLRPCGPSAARICSSSPLMKLQSGRNDGLIARVANLSKPQHYKRKFFLRPLGGSYRLPIPASSGLLLNN